MERVKRKEKDMNKEGCDEELKIIGWLQKKRRNKKVDKMIHTIIWYHVIYNISYIVIYFMIKY